jgi:hypothetical protein
MQVDAAFLAWKVETTPQGRVSAHDIIGSIRVPQRGVLPGLTYLAMLTFEPMECDCVHTAQLMLISPDGHVSPQAEVPFEIVVNPFDAYGYSNVLASVDLRISSEGIYLVELHLDGHCVHTRRVQVHVGLQPNDPQPDR